MPITEADLKRIAAYYVGTRDSNIFFDLLSGDHPSTRILVHAVRARAMKPKFRIGEGVLFACSPREEEIAWRKRLDLGRFR